MPLIFIAFFVLLFLMMFLGDPAARLAFGHTEIASGEVTTVATGDACQGRTRDVTYRFSPPGGPEYRSVQSVCASSPYFEVSRGDTVPVRFLVSDPSINTLAGEGGSKEVYYVPFMLFPFFVLFFFAPFLLPQLRRLLRNRKIFRNGRVTRAAVVFVKQSSVSTWWVWPSPRPSELFVVFTLPSGATVEAGVPCENAWLLNHLSPGETVHVAYTPEEPTRAVLLEAHIR